MGKRIKLVFMLLFFSFFTSGCVTFIDPGDAGLKWRPITTGLSEETLEEGFYFYMPWNSVLVYSLQWRSYTEKIQVLTEDDLHIRVDVSVVVRPIASELSSLQLEIGENYYTNIIKPEFQTVVRSEMANYIMVEIPEKSAMIEKIILEKLKKRIEGKHLDLDTVTIDHIQFTPRMLSAIEAKLTKEQEKIQKEFELQIEEKDADIARARARGQADSAIIRARGQAEAQKVIDKTLTKRFLQYKAFDSPNTKFIYVPTGADGLPIIISPEVQ
jgi:regulator of protease activity HflC (stomatin/prohibitin superfamily)